MSTKKPAAPAAPPTYGDQSAPAPKPTSGPGSRGPTGPRKAKPQTGPASRAVEKDGKVVALVLNSLGDQTAIEQVTGKYTARIVGISEGIILARQQDLPVFDEANPVHPADPT